MVKTEPRIILTYTHASESSYGVGHELDHVGHYLPWLWIPMTEPHANLNMNIQELRLNNWLWLRASVAPSKTKSYTANVKQHKQKPKSGFVVAIQ